MALVRVLMLVTNFLLLMGPEETDPSTATTPTGETTPDIVSVFPEITISVKPDTLSWTGGYAGQRGTHVEVICSITGPRDNVYVQTIFLERRTKADPIFMSVVTQLLNKGKTVVGTDMPTMNVYYTNQTFGNFLRVNFYKVWCRDAGTYRCRALIIGLGGETSPLMISDKNLREVNPDKVTLTIDPEGVREWTEGQTLILTCHAAVGSLSTVSDPQVVWKFRKEGDSPEKWSQITSNAVMEIGTVTTDVQCIKRWSTSLTVTLNTSHTGLEFGCFLRGNSVVHSVGIVHEKTGTYIAITTSDSPTNASTDPEILSSEEEEELGSSKPSKPNGMSWVPIVVGITVGTVAAVGIAFLFFYYKDKRRKAGDHRSRISLGSGRERNNTVVTNPGTRAFRPNDADGSASVVSSSGPDIADDSASVISSTLESSTAVESSSTAEYSVADNTSAVESSDA